MRERFIYLLSLSSLALIMGMINFVSPELIGSFGLLIFFFLLFFVFFGLSFFFISLYRRIAKQNCRIDKRQYFYAVAISFAPIFLLLMRAFGMFNVFTVLSVFLMEFLACFLIKNKIGMVE